MGFTINKVYTRRSAIGKKYESTSEKPDISHSRYPCSWFRHRHVYILQAPPVEQKGVPKLQVHKRTALRGRPTVDSKPIVYTKDVYRFSLDPQYISNLNSRKLERELLFNASLAHRARLKAQRLDESLKTATDWQKMFADFTESIRFRPSASPIEVLLSGEEWRLRDATGAAYTVVRADNNVSVYLPDLREAFDGNKISLSKDLEVLIEQKNRRWIIKDKTYKQAYTIQKRRRETARLPAIKVDNSHLPV